MSHPAHGCKSTTLMAYCIHPWLVQIARVHVIGRNLMAQEHKQSGNHKQEVSDEETTETPQGAETTEGLDADVDAILDEIDDVLEENAEDFVKSFIQKGGQ